MKRTKIMPLPRRLLPLVALIAAALTPALSGAATGPYGLWMTQKKGVIVDVYACGDALCGRTVWLKKMTHKDGAPRLDAKNPDTALRTRHWCGIEVITGVKPAGVNKWDDGDIYDPKTGETFSFEMKHNGDTMKVRGYLGVKLLGKSETWTRTDGAGVTLCSPT